MRKGIAGLAAGVVGVLSFAALLPSAAQAHPCAVAWTLENASFLSANNATWAATLPTVEEFSEKDCAGELGGLSGIETDANVAADPVGDATSSHVRTPNLVPNGFSARNVPLVTSLVGINSDLAFKDNLVFQGHFSGFRVLDVDRPREPGPARQLRGLPSQLRPGRRHRLRQPAGALVGLGQLDRQPHLRRPARRRRLRGHPPLRHLRPGRARGSSAGCGCRRPATRRARPRAAARTPRPRCRTPARGNLYIYNGGSSGSCTRHGHRPYQALGPDGHEVPRRAAAGRASATTTT